LWHLINLAPPLFAQRAGPFLFLVVGYGFLLDDFNLVESVAH
jgi:hypothetical protein